MRTLIKYILPVMITACFIVYTGKQTHYTKENSSFFLIPASHNEIATYIPAIMPADTLHKLDTLRMQSQHPMMDYRMFKKTLFLHRGIPVA